MKTQSRITVVIVAGWIVGVAWYLPQAWADTLWTNVPAGTAWEDAANWDKGVPSGTAVLRADVSSNGIAQLTNKTASYTVNYNVPANTFNDLNIENADAFKTTLNINTNGFTMVGINEGNPLGRLILANVIMNVNSGGVVSVGADMIFWKNVTLNVNQGATLSWGNNAYNQRLNLNFTTVNIRGTVSGTTNLTYAGNSWVTIAAGGDNSTITIDGGNAMWDSTYVSYNGYLGMLNITNNGVLTILNGVLEVGQGMYCTPYDAKVNVYSGVVTNNGLLNIAIASGISDAYTGSGAVNISGGSFIQRGITTVGVGRNGALNISGSGLFRTTNMVYVGGTTAPTLSGSATASGMINMTNGQFIVTNSAGTATLFVGNAITGTVILAGGTMTVDNLVATNAGLSFLSFSGGTLNTRASAISNGTVLVVGNGVGAASLSLLGGTHLFSNGLVINTNAVFAIGGTNATESATINGDVTLQTNAVFDYDFSQTTNDWVQVNGTVTLPAQATLQVRTLDSSIRTPIPVLQAIQLNGNASGWNVTRVNGRHYKARVAGNQLVLQRVPIGTVFTVK